MGTISWPELPRKGLRVIRKRHLVIGYGIAITLTGVSASQW